MVTLGEIVIDKVTGLTGVATARLTELYNTTKILVEPRVESGEQPAQWFAESRLNTSGQMHDNFSVTVGEEEMVE